MSEGIHIQIGIYFFVVFYRVLIASYPPFQYIDKITLFSLPIISALEKRKKKRKSES